VFIAADDRQLDDLKEAMRVSLAWNGIVRDAETERLDMKTSDIALAKDKARESQDTMNTRLRETWCWLVYPYQDSPEATVEFSTARIPVQNGILDRASKRLVHEEALLPEIGPERLNRELEKYIWNGKDHLFLKDLWEYMNRYTYLPRLKNRETFIKSVRAAVGGAIPGPFAYAEQWDNQTESYAGLVIEGAANTPVTIDSDTVIVRPGVAARHRPNQTATTADGTESHDTQEPELVPRPVPEPAPSEVEQRPTRFQGTVMVSPERSARDIHRIVEAIIEQLTMLPDADVSIRLEIDAESPSGLNRAKVRTLIENATTLNFIDKTVE